MHKYYFGFFECVMIRNTITIIAIMYKRQSIQLRLIKTIKIFEQFDTTRKVKIIHQTNYLEWLIRY